MVSDTTLKMKVNYTYSVQFLFSRLRLSPVVNDIQYSADAEKVSLLLKVPLCFDLEMYGSSGKLKKVRVSPLILMCGF